MKSAALLLSLCAVLPVLNGCAGTQATPPADQPKTAAIAACQTGNAVAQAVVATLAAESSEALVLIDAPPFLPFEISKDAAGLSIPVPLTARSPWWSQGWWGEGPDAAMVDAWMQSNHETIAGCWRSQASSPLKIVSDDEVGSIIRGNGGPDRTGIFIETPVIDASNRTALVTVATVCRGLCGHREMLLMKNDGTAWKLAGRKLFAIS